MTNACAFVVGFSVIFIVLGVFAGTLGRLLTQFRTPLNIVCGLIVVLLGLSYLEVIRIPMTVLVGADGNLIGAQIGVLSEAQLRTILDTYITPANH